MYIPKKYENIMSNDTAASGMRTRDEFYKWLHMANNMIKNVKPIIIEPKEKKSKKK